MPVCPLWVFSGGFRGEAELTAVGADALAAKPEDILTYLHQH